MNTVNQNYTGLISTASMISKNYAAKLHVVVYSPQITKHISNCDISACYRYVIFKF